MSELYPLIDPYVEVLEEYFRLVCQLWLERVSQGPFPADRQKADRQRAEPRRGP